MLLGHCLPKLAAIDRGLRLEPGPACAGLAERKMSAMGSWMVLNDDGEVEGGHKRRNLGDFRKAGVH